MNNNIKYFVDDIRKSLPAGSKLPDGCTVYVDTRNDKVTLQASVSIDKNVNANVSCSSLVIMAWSPKSRE